MRRYFFPLVLWLWAFLAPSLGFADKTPKKDLILATTTSTVDSGLLDVLIPLFEKKTGLTVKTIAVGSGLAIEMGRRGEADVLLVHAPDDEERLMQEGCGVNRRAVMHNDFILLGPANDPAHVRDAKTVVDAFNRIAKSGAMFISRGDKSGTHAKELSLWRQKPTAFSQKWYLESGQGMGPTLIIADQKRSYVLSDRATYFNFRNKVKLTIVYEGDNILFNPYHSIEVNPSKHPKVNAAGARAFTDFITSPEIQKVIAEFGQDKYGQSQFFPDAEHGRR